MRTGNREKDYFWNWAVSQLVSLAPAQSVGALVGISPSGYTITPNIQRIETHILASIDDDDGVDDGVTNPDPFGWGLDIRFDLVTSEWVLFGIKNLIRRVQKLTIEGAETNEDYYYFRVPLNGRYSINYAVGNPFTPSPLLYINPVINSETNGITPSPITGPISGTVISGGLYLRTSDVVMVLMTRTTRSWGSQSWPFDNNYIAQVGGLFLRDP